MLSILNVTIPFFALVLCGYLAARRRMLPATAVGALNTFVLWFSLPAMLFRFAADTPIGELVNPRAFGAYALAGVGTLLFTAWGLRWAAAERWSEAAIGGLAATWSNWGYMGLAMIPALLGAPALAPMLPAGIADLVLLVSLSLALASLDAGSGANWRHAVLGALRGVARNPLIWAIAAGIACSGLALRLPGPLDQFLRLLGSAAGPVALFSIGMSLWREGERARFDGVALLVSIKLLLHPLATWLIARHLFDLPAFDSAALMLMAALPVAGTVFLFAEREHANAARAASLILWSTLLAFGSFSGFAALVEAGWLR